MPRSSIAVLLSQVVDKRTLPHINHRSVTRSGEAMEVGRYHARTAWTQPGGPIENSQYRWYIHKVADFTDFDKIFSSIFSLLSNAMTKAGTHVQMRTGTFHYYFKSSLGRVMRTILSHHGIDKRFELFNQMFSMDATKPLHTDTMLNLHYLVVHISLKIVHNIVRFF